MEKLLKPYDKEYMRMAILKHEETFKEQVYELHRLYHIQKVLMKSTIGHKKESWNLQNETSFSHQLLNCRQRKLDLEQPADVAEEYNADTDGDDGGVVEEIIEESEIELTLGPTRYNNNNNNSNRRKRAEAPLTSDSGPSFSSSSTGSSHVNRTSSSRRTHHQIRSKNGHVVPEMTSGYHRSGSKLNSNCSSIDVVVEEQLRQDERLKLPPWLFQVLSLNMT